MKKQLLFLLDTFVEICKRNGLKYYLAAGSVLGAVRHKGMIPWDDDIDVYMSRKDYEKLQLLPDAVWGESMRLATWRKTKNYRYDFLKLELLNTTVLERFHPAYVGGVFLDVFPLDVYPNDKGCVNRIEKELPIIEKRYIECTLKNNNECQSLLELFGLFVKRMVYNHRSWMEKWENIPMCYKGEGDLIADFHSYFYCHGGCPVDYFGEGVMMEFESKMYNVPEKWDDYLKQVYGDYMVLPPIEKRQGHSFEFVNYERRLSDADIKFELRNIRKKYAYPFSLKREAKFVLRKIGLMR